jgi:small subunit ribosomal protein S21
MLKSPLLGLSLMHKPSAAHTQAGFRILRQFESKGKMCYTHRLRYAKNSRTLPIRLNLENTLRGGNWLVEVQVRDNNVDQALRALKKKMQREGIFREMKMRRHYEKPSERRVRETAEAARRARKLKRKREQFD